MSSLIQLESSLIQLEISKCIWCITELSTSIKELFYSIWELSDWVYVNLAFHISDRSEKHRLNRGRSVLASYQVSLKSYLWFRLRWAKNRISYWIHVSENNANITTFPNGWYFGNDFSQKINPSILPFENSLLYS